MEGPVVAAEMSPSPECPCDPSPLLALPHGCLAVCIQALPLRTALVLATACRELRAAVAADCLRHVSSLDLNTLSGAGTAEALAWAFRSESLPGLKAVSASGAACLDALMTVCALPASRRRLGALTSLCLDSLRQLQDAHVAALAEACPNLEVLSLPKCAKLGDAAALAVGARLPRLRVAGCADWTALSDAGVAAIAAGCRGLEEITLDGCLRVGSEGLSALARLCPRLRRVSIAKSYSVTDVALAALGASEAATSGCLQEVILRQCPRVASPGLLSRCAQLTTLDLSGCPRVDTSSLSPLLSGCGPSLATLRLHGCVGVGGEALAGVGHCCPGLRCLDVRGLALTDAHLLELAKECTSLRSLTLAWCTKLTDTGLCPLLERNPELQDVDIEALYNLSDLALATLAAAAPGLRRLVVRMCHRLSPDAIVALVAVSTELRALAISGILDDAGTTALVARVRRTRPACALHW
ncbi:hypothetical protein HYH03_007885 [Edaphochlamys debaryana]|uniref:F-box/LRR-repeat protein 15-like leucin rich repeat domain-containing protein n=1 Tax=Edaphochlamys debaryana TaxID=47281 RepID=A0A835Y7Q7_9CHLO|nr:hypothetical protein HYH03_007885 [Edaphochlamys debaryana]|eukprot:KAG2493955.1 hypothetical protein HYH03_007885 [Edaphochlamys debaryana]